MEIIFEFIVEIFFEVVIEGLGALFYTVVSNRKIPYVVKLVLYFIMMALFGLVTYILTKKAYESWGIVGGAICVIIGVIFMILVSCICVKGYRTAREGWEKEDMKKVNKE